MSEQFLSQDEVDALLAGVNGEPEEVEVAPLPTNGGGVQQYDLARQERIVRGRMPTLEIVNERFARNFRQAMFKLMRRTPDISVGPVQVHKYSVFLGNLVVPTNLNVMHVRPLRGNGLVVFEPQLVFAVIDSLFGGNGKLHARIEGRDFSATEQRIIRNLVAGLTESYKVAWKDVYPIELEYVRSEMQTQFASIATASEVVISTRFWVEIGDAAGAIHICIPYGVLEPIRETLYSSVSTDQVADSRSWVTKLSRQLELADLELVAPLANAQLSFGDLLNLGPGDFVELDLERTIDVTVGAMPFLKCTWGTSEGRYAIKIEEFLTTPAAMVSGARND